MTDNELKFRLAREIPDIVYFCAHGPDPTNRFYFWKDTNKLVNELEWLEVMRRAEVALNAPDYTAWHYNLVKSRNAECEPCCRCNSAPWQQRAEALLAIKRK